MPSSSALRFSVFPSSCRRADRSASKRCFAGAAPIKAALYDGLARAFEANAALRPVIADLLLAQLAASTNDDPDEPPLRLERLVHGKPTQDGGVQPAPEVAEPFADLLRALWRCMAAAGGRAAADDAMDLDEPPDGAEAQELPDLAGPVACFVERLTKSELEEYELDKSTGLPGHASWRLEPACRPASVGGDRGCPRSHCGAAREGGRARRVARLCRAAGRARATAAGRGEGGAQARQADEQASGLQGGRRG